MRFNISVGACLNFYSVLFVLAKRCTCLFDQEWDYCLTGICVHVSNVRKEMF